jgi:hypothetical protein
MATDDRPKLADDAAVGSYPIVDIPANNLAKEQVLHEITQQILGAYERMPPDVALRTIAAVWEHLDRVAELAAARSRLLLGKLPKPKLASLPDWFEKQRPQFVEHEEGELAATPAAIAVAELLVRAVAAEHGELTAEVGTGLMGRVLLDWHVASGRLQWMVEALDIPWPAVKVYQLSRRSGSEPKPAAETRIFYNAFDALESLQQFLSDH